MSGGHPGDFPSEPYAVERGAMVVEQLARRGIRDERVLAAMGEIPRHAFVHASMKSQAYQDRPLPIGQGQTISQPYMVARATELAAPRATDRALEVGAGCGYQAAVLGKLCAAVYAIEFLPELAEKARANLHALGLGNVVVAEGDGSAGWPEQAPYDVIVVSAGAPRVPPFLLDQLADGGRLVLPLGEPDAQKLVLVRRIGDRYETIEDTACRYVDLVGRYGVGGRIASC